MYSLIPWLLSSLIPYWRSSSSPISPWHDCMVGLARRDRCTSSSPHSASLLCAFQWFDWNHWQLDVTTIIPNFMITNIVLFCSKIKVLTERYSSDKCLWCVDKSWISVKLCAMASPLNSSWQCLQLLWKKQRNCPLEVAFGQWQITSRSDFIIANPFLRGFRTCNNFPVNLLLNRKICYLTLFQVQTLLFLIITASLYFD